jgi:hypothetical protein
MISARITSKLIGFKLNCSDKIKTALLRRIQDAGGLVVGDIPPISIGQDIGRIARGGPAHKTEVCGARHSSAHAARHLSDILEIA